MRFAHISDTHIRNYKYQKEYRAVFSQLYEKLKEQKPDYIVHCGDIAHTKTQISPEFVELASEFLSSLADIAPTYVLLGNHDGNLKNSARQDAISPIINNLNHPDLHLLKGYQQVELENNIVLHSLCVFDNKKNWVLEPDQNYTNIALYHGAVRGSETDIGWILEGETTMAQFQHFDFAFLGDIHKTYQKLDDEGRALYPGSTIQQNFGESNDKGYVLWDIEDKNTFSSQHIVLENPKPFISLYLTKTGKLPKGTAQWVPQGSRMRLISEHNLPIATLKRAADNARVKFKPESIAFLNKYSTKRGSSPSAHGERMNLRDIGVQQKLMKEYLDEFELSEEQLQKVYDLNEHIITLLSEDDETKRNIEWNLSTLNWDNLFNYASENKVDFQNFSGIVGIFGKNYSGKSSIIDSLLYTVFNSSSKNVRKNVDLINQNKDYGSGDVSFTIGDRTYTISRFSKKYTKRLRGVESVEAKTELDFSVHDEATGETTSLNGTTRNETDANIRKYLGSLDDFLMTSMMSQMNSLNFINEGTTKRKEILAKFLDLEVLDQKFRKAKEISQLKKAQIKNLEGTNYDQLIEKENKNVATAKSNAREAQHTCEGLKKQLEKLNQQKADYEFQISSGNEIDINIAEVEERLSLHENEAGNSQNKLTALHESISNAESKVKEYNDFIKDFDADTLREKREIYLEKADDLNALASRIREKESEREQIQAKKALLESVPCGEEYAQCRFIKDAHSAMESYDVVDQAIRILKGNEDNVRQQIKALSIEEANKLLADFDIVLQDRQKLENTISTNKSSLQMVENAIIHNKEMVEVLNKKKEIYKEFEAQIKVIEVVKSKLKEANTETSKLKRTIDSCTDTLLASLKKEAGAEERLKNARQQKAKLEKARKEFSTYVYLMRCFHPNGIPYEVTKKLLPVINAEIEKILEGVVDFQIYFEEDGNKLNIFLKHPKYDARPVELGSGAEKTIAATAIRLALLNVSSLPKSNIFIMDEPATALDTENMDGFIKILEMTRTQFDTVFLISHLDGLKDIVDTEIIIEKKNGYAFVNV